MGIISQGVYNYSFYDVRESQPQLMQSRKISCLIKVWLWKVKLAACRVKASIWEKTQINAFLLLGVGGKKGLSQMEAHIYCRVIHQKVISGIWVWFSRRHGAGSVTYMLRFLPLMFLIINTEKARLLSDIHWCPHKLGKYCNNQKWAWHQRDAFELIWELVSIHPSIRFS